MSRWYPTLPAVRAAIACAYRYNESAKSVGARYGISEVTVLKYVRAEGEVVREPFKRVPKE